MSLESLRWHTATFFKRSDSLGTGVSDFIGMERHTHVFLLLRHAFFR